MKSDCKSFQVFDFNVEDELAEVTSAKILSKFKNPSAIDKYNFLEHVARGADFQSKETSNLQCVDIDGVDNDQNCENALSCVPLGSDGEGTVVTKQMCVLDEGFLFSSASHEQHPEFTTVKVETRRFPTQLESRSSSLGAASPGNSQLNCALRDSPSSDELVDVVLDADESMSASSPSTSSDIPGDDVTLDGHGPLSGYCFGGWEMGNGNVAVVRPDYVVYRGKYCTESVLIFSSSCIELKGSTAHGNKGTFSFQWGIDDIVDIDSQWSERLQVAMVKLRLISKDAMQAEDGQGTSGIEELQFAAVELNWYKKQEEIMSLDVRYKALWNVVFDSVVGGDREDLAGGNGIPKKRYLPSFDEPFEEVVYPKGDSDAVTISKQDVDLLEPDTFVNDTIIDFYIKYLKNEIQHEERHRFHFFNSFFFRKLIDLDKDPSSAFEGRAAFQRVRKWTRKVNLFEKDYVFIPVNFNYHWSLIVICHPGEVDKFQDEDMEKSLKVPCILHMDSIKGSHTGLKDLVQSYLWEEWKEKQKPACEDISSKFLNLRFVPLELPQQQNSFDCGLFLLHYVERFLKDAPFSFSPFKITNCSSFLNVDWFPAAEPSLKRVQIQNLICEILEKENSPAACSANPCSSACNYPASNNEMETGVELVSERCSPSKSCPGKLSSAPLGERIEITLLPSSSQCAGDSGLVLREFFEEGATAGSFLDGQFQTFDRVASFNEFKGAMSQVEEDVEAGGPFIYSESNATDFQETAEVNPAACVFPYSSSGIGAEASWNRGIHQDGQEEHVDESPETSICASDDDSLEVEVRENNIEHPNTEEQIDQPRSPSMENEDCLTESFASAPSEILDVPESQSPRHMLDSNGNVDHLISCSDSLPELSCQDRDVQENGEISCAEVCLVGDNLVSKPDGQEVLHRVDDELGSESTREPAAKRVGDDSVAESGEQQPSKRLRLASPSDEEGTPKRSLANDLQL